MPQVAEPTKTDPLAASRAMARQLAEDGRAGEPAISRVLWFPHPEEVRLLEVYADAVPSPKAVAPFYWPASPRYGLPLRSASVLIRPEEVGRASLPTGWGNWDEAVDI